VLQAGNFELLWSILENNICRTNKLRRLPLITEPASVVGAFPRLDSDTASKRRLVRQFPLKRQGKENL